MAEDDVNEACTCEPYKTCKWANHTVFEFSELLAKGDPSGVELANSFQKRICDEKTRSVYCCYDQQSPTDKELNILKEFDAQQKVIMPEKKTQWNTGVGRGI